MNDKREEARRRRDALLRRNESPFGRFMRKYKVLVVILVILLVICAAVIFLLTRSKPEPDMGGYDFDVTMEPEGENEIDAGGEIDVEDVTAAEKPIEELEGLGDGPTKDKGYKHYLLLGLDGLSGGFKGKRSDAIMIASVNQDNGRLVLTSIPRDTYVYIEGKGYDKITHAYAYGQAQLTVETIENNFGESCGSGRRRSHNADPGGKQQYQRLFRRAGNPGRRKPSDRRAGPDLLSGAYD